MPCRAGSRGLPRAVDEGRSTAWLSFLPLQEERKLRPGEVAELAVEIDPSSMLFRAGEVLELILAGHESLPSPPFRKDVSCNRGFHVVHTGGRHPSHLLVPVIPVSSRTSG